MQNIRFVNVGATLIGMAFFSGASAAQVTVSPQRNAPRFSAGAGQPNDPQTLAAIAGKIDWDTRTRGALMIVSPEETYPNSDRGVASEDTAGQAPAQGLTATPAGTFRIAQVADVFDRRLVGVGTLSVLAPRLMTVLTYEHLPKPDPLAGMTMAAKLRLLESTFTADQWAAAGSDNGIGVAELDRKQSVIFLSMLPDPFVVEPATAIGARASAEASTTLTASQRAATRLRLQKSLDWSFVEGEKGHLGLGSNTRQMDPSFKYRLPYVMPAIFNHHANDEPLSRTESFGAALTRSAPNRAKPSQLPAGWAALDTPIALTPATRVGELISQIARKTGALLYCDPRYAKRTVTFVGDSARAGDVLKALCWAITGTWRRVGDGFVLTDDLVGLGVRHVKIDDWFEENSLYALLYAEKSRAGLATKQYQALGWSENDPYAPGASLIRELDAFVARPPIPLPGSGSATESPLIPMSDLPQALQDHARDQISRYQTMRQEHPNIGVDNEPVRKDVVRMGVQVEASFYLEGFGKISSNNAMGVDVYSDILAKPYTMPDFAPKKPDASAIVFDPSPSPRALLINPKDKGEIAKLALEARKRGLNQLWIVVQNGESDLLSGAIREGKKNGLAVHAVVRLMRASAAADPDSLDRNLLGESMTEYVRRRRSQAQQIRAATGTVDTTTGRASSVNLSRWLRDDFTELLLERGDFRQTTASESTAITAEIARLATTSGLSGLVIQDKGAPGSEAGPKNNERPYYSMFSPDFEMQMGYTLASRIDCLKALGFDPIDLSPLPQGDEQLRIGLPFFRDPGGVAQQSMIRRGTDSTSLWRAWSNFRHDKSEAVVAEVVKGVRAQRPDLPVLISQFDDPTNGHYNWYGSVEKPDVAVKVEQIPDRVSGSAVIHTVDVAGIARSQSRVAFRVMPLGGPSRYQVEDVINERLARLAEVIKDAKKWDGIVLDLSDASPGETLDILHLLPLTVDKN